MFESPRLHRCARGERGRSTKAGRKRRARGPGAERPELEPGAHGRRRRTKRRPATGGGRKKRCNHGAMKQRVPLLVLAIALVAVSAVCAAGGSSPAAAARTPSIVIGHASEASTARSTRHKPWTGIGATLQAWKTAHRADHGPGALCTAANSCFGPSLDNSTCGNVYEFTTVSVDANIVDGYSQCFGNDTSFATAVREMLALFPKDARVGRLIVVHTPGTGTCGLFNVTSRTLARVFANPKIGDPQGVVGVDMNYINSNYQYVFSTSNVQEASLGVAPVDPSAGC